MLPRPLMKQPSALYILFFSEFTARFSYWGIQSLLALYLINTLHFSATLAYEIFGVFTASTFALSIIGGLVADSFFGYKKTLIFGITVALIGNVFLAIDGSTFIFLGLACINYGIGIFLPNNSNLLGCFYSENDNRRDHGFTIFYMGTNIGGLLGPVLSGILASSIGLHYAFLLNVFFLALWLILYFFSRKLFSNVGNATKISFFKKKYQPIGLTLITISFIYGLFMLLTHPDKAGDLIKVIGLATLIFVIYVTYSHYKKHISQILCLILMAMFALIFFACEFQVNSSLLEFIDHYVDHKILFFSLPTQAFAALEPAFVIICAPIFICVWRWLQLKSKEPSAIAKMIVGIAFSSVAFYCFGYSANLIKNTTATISISWILGGNLILGAAEVCIMPPLISSITRLAPKNFKATLMGSLYVALAFSGYISGLIAQMTDHPGDEQAISAHSYAHTYFSISYASAALSILSIAGLLTYILARGRRRFFNQ